jgi:hypothetical protein
MFSSNSTSRDDARHLLGGDNPAEDEDHEVVWEQSSAQSKRHTTTDSESELWDQDPLSSGQDSHELQQIPTPTSHSTSSQPRSKRAIAPPEDHGAAGADLQAEFERIFSPVKSSVCQVGT